MKWQYYSLASNDQKAKMQVLENLQIGSQEHTLSKKLLQRFSETSGEMLLIAFETLDLKADCLYKYASYDRLPAWESVTWMDAPQWGLISFVDKYLFQTKDPVVLCEDIFATRKSVTKSPRESRMLFFKDEVYHVLTSEDAAKPETIECSLRESRDHWAVGVCSSCDKVPHGNISSEIFFDAIVANTTHIFTPALDGEGYLVWSPLVSIK